MVPPDGVRRRRGVGGFLEILRLLHAPEPHATPVGDGDDVDLAGLDAGSGWNSCSRVANFHYSRKVRQFEEAYECRRIFSCCSSATPMMTVRPHDERVPTLENVRKNLAQCISLQPYFPSDFTYETMSTILPSRCGSDAPRQASDLLSPRPGAGVQAVPLRHRRRRAR